MFDNLCFTLVSTYHFYNQLMSSSKHAIWEIPSCRPIFAPPLSPLPLVVQSSTTKQKEWLVFVENIFYSNLNHYFLQSIAFILPNLQSGKSHPTDRFLPWFCHHSLASLYRKRHCKNNGEFLFDNLLFTQICRNNFSLILLLTFLECAMVKYNNQLIEMGEFKLVE